MTFLTPIKFKKPLFKWHINKVIVRIVKIVVLFVVFFMVIGMSAYFTLTLIIKSEDIVIIPELAGKDVVYALEILSNLELNTKVKGSEYSINIPKNHVIFQEPEAGEEIKKGRDVRIIISKGDKTIMMPRLTGLKLQQARIILEENDLHQGEITATYSESIEKEDIIAQYPSPGRLINRNDKADFLISLGQRPNTYKMPDLTGLSLDYAILLIEQNNFFIGEITSIFREDKPKNVIAGQEPAAGHQILDGNTINLVINRKPDNEKPKYRHGVSGVRLFRHKLDAGYLKRHIRIRLNCFGVSNIIFDNLVKPDEEVWILVPNNREATVFLYEDDTLIKTRVFDSL